MKILYSQIKKLVPELKKAPEEVGKAMTLTGFMVDEFKEVEYQNKKDHLIGLEIRQNRPDCLSLIGVAKEVAAYYDFSVSLPEISPIKEGKDKLDIKIDASDYVKRLTAVKLEGVENRESPSWLKELLSLYQIRSINFLVDLSNYVMLLTGHPSHLFDADKINGNISWCINKNFKKITTLDGSNIDLNKNELIIRDEKNILGLAGIIGGDFGKIEKNTTNIIMEMAVYDNFLIMRNSRDLNIVTEASNRLTKELDPNGIDFSAKLLISLILKNCGGKVSSSILDYYPEKERSPEIEFDPRSPSLYAGIEISTEKAKKILENLSFKVEILGGNLKVTPPVNRKDISVKEDLIEEVVRINGYDKIPSDEIPEIKTVEKITPTNIKLMEKIRDILTALEFDEVLSWPVTKEEKNKVANYLDWESVDIENSINENYPVLRQSLLSGLKIKSQEHIKKNIEYIKIFELGKIFGKKNGDYIEQNSLGALLNTLSREEKMASFKDSIEKTLRLIGLSDIWYRESKIKPKVANSYSCWDIFSKKEVVGIMYKIRPQNSNENSYFTEINIDKTVELLKKTKNNPVTELTQKLIVLDANIEIKEGSSIFDFLKKVEDKRIWSINIVDEFSLENKTRYTVRVSYEGLSDIEAKEIHFKIFGLKKE
jgi:phenylalanyl-tRNA synthetase beta chain